MRKLLNFFFAAFMCAASVSFAQSVRAAETCPRLVEFASLDMLTDEGALLIKVELNHKPYYMSFGMGVALSMISQQAVRELHLHKTESTMYALVDGAGRKIDTMAKVDSFKLGDLETKDVSFFTRQREDDEKDQPAVNGLPYGGTLGNNVLTFYDVELDFAHKKIHLLSTKHCDGGVVYWSDSYSDTKIYLFSGTYDIGVKLNDYNAQAAVSTSSEWTYVDIGVAKHFLGFDEKTPGVERMSNDYAYFDGYPVYKFRLPSLQIAGIMLKNPEVLVTHLGKNRDERHEETTNQAILGLKEMRKLRLYFASKEERLYVTPANAGK